MKGALSERRVSNFSSFTKGRIKDATLIKKMKKKQNSAFRAAKRSKTRKDQRMSILYSELNRGYEPDGFCLFLWKATMPDWIPENLRADIVDALRGYDEDMALEIADSLVSCWSGAALHVTGIDHVDELLGRLYLRILSYAHRNGIKLLYDK